jgi:hypothetical protein
VTRAWIGDRLIEWLLIGAAVLAFSGCAHAPTRPPGTWEVVGGTPAQQAQALALVDAAKTALPDSKGLLARGGVVRLMAEIPSSPFGCFATPPKKLSGCSGPGRIDVLWPHPKCPAGADLTCSALAHELAHLALGTSDQGRSDAGGALVVKEYRRVLEP